MRLSGLYQHMYGARGGCIFCAIVAIFTCIVCCVLCVCVRECLAHISAGPSHAACLAESFFLLEALLELLQAAPQLVDRLNLAL